jgi:hypothetical protein
MVGRKSLILALIFIGLVFSQTEPKKDKWLNPWKPDTRKGLSYTWTAVTGTNVVGASDVFLYASFDRTQTTPELGAPDVDQYIHWKIKGGSGDSTKTIAKVLHLVNLTEDTTFTYKTSLTDKDGRYSVGDDSTFIAPLSEPVYGGLRTEILKNILDWSNVADRGIGTEISRDTLGGSSWEIIATTDDTTTTYVDSGSVAAGKTYIYRLRKVGYTDSSDYVSFGSATVQPQDYSLIFNPATPTYSMDSTDVSPDFNVTVQFINASNGVDIDLDSLVLDSEAVFTVTDTLNFPITVADDDSLGIEFVIDREQSGGLKQTTVTIYHEFGSQELNLNVTITLLPIRAMLFSHTMVLHL